MSLFKHIQNCILATLIFSGLPKSMLGQEIIWEKSFHLESESNNAVCLSMDGQILCGGKTSKFGITVPGNAGFYRAVLMKYSLEGDTLWLKKLPILGHVSNLFLNQNGMIWATCQVTNPNTDPLNNFYFPAVFLLANDSSIVIQKQFPEMHRFEVVDSYPTVDGGIIVFGNRSPSTIPGYEQDFYAFKVDAIGNLSWSRAFNPGTTNSFCQGGHVEPMANGNFLASGSMGSRIVSFEINPETGNDTNFVKWYQSTGLQLVNFGNVAQTINQNHFVTGSIQTSPPKFYISCYTDSLVKIFGGAHLRGSLPPFMNSDGSCIIFTALDADTRFLSRLNVDSTDQWKISLTSSIPGRKTLYDLLYNPDGTGYMVGYNTQTGQSDNFYIAKFSGIGEPFDPTGVKQIHLVKTDAFPYPNPTNQSFRFKKEFQKGEVYLFTIEGKRVLSQPKLLPDVPINVSGLAAGTYLYRAVLDGRPHWGKIVKE